MRCASSWIGWVASHRSTARWRFSQSWAARTRDNEERQAQCLIEMRQIVGVWEAAGELEEWGTIPMEEEGRGAKRNICV
jgi:hypothetical protein